METESSESDSPPTSYLANSHLTEVCPFVVFSQSSVFHLPFSVMSINNHSCLLNFKTYTTLTFSWRFSFLNIDGKSSGKVCLRILNNKPHTRSLQDYSLRVVRLMTYYQVFAK